MAISIIDHFSRWQNAGATSPIDTTGATLIVIVCSNYNTLTPPADNKGNTYTFIASQSGGAHLLSMYYCENPTVGSGHTFNVPTFNYNCFDVIVVGGMRVSGVYDSHAKASTTTSTTASAGSTTPAEENELLIAAVGCGSGDGGSYSNSIDGGYTVLDEEIFVVANTQALTTAYKIVPTPSAQNPTWTSNDPTSRTRNAILASFKGVLPLAVDFSFDYPSINYGQDIIATPSVSGGVGSLSYAWRLDNPVGTPFSTSSSAVTITNPSAGSHTVYLSVTDDNGTETTSHTFFVGTITDPASLANSAVQTYTTNVTSPTWSIVSGSGSINSSTGQFTAPSSGTGETVIKATNSGDADEFATKTIVWGFPRTVVLDPNTLSYAKSGLPSGHSYSARVRAKDEAGNYSAWSNSVEVST